MGHKKKQLKPKPGWHGRIWLEGEEGTLVGYGRAVLLEKIQLHGSISKASTEMKMSYKHAWNLVKSMNRQTGTAVVITRRGGNQGGGAILSETGIRLLQLFWKVQKKMEQFLDEESSKWLQNKL